DAYLESAQEKIKEVPLWRPLCRVPELPTGKITVVIDHRSDFESCANRWTPSNLHCALNEPITYLADSDQKRTWARREVRDRFNQDIIWISSRPVAWQGWLFIEYQYRIQFFALLLTVATLFTWLLYQLRFTLREQESIREIGQPIPPRIAELILLWVAGDSRSMPADANEEYSQMIIRGSAKKTADRWYRRQVLCSILPMAIQNLTREVKRTF
ncbi:MAG TPA: hypothetical protein VN223_07910, partial [Candidatus Elarobacter sp.]|nr:hypothetical protein [Candidatus Elarobacter sp.]